MPEFGFWKDGFGGPHRGALTHLAIWGGKGQPMLSFPFENPDFFGVRLEFGSGKWPQKRRKKVKKIHFFQELVSPEGWRLLLELGSLLLRTMNKNADREF
jgi:hypothetical protein